MNGAMRNNSIMMIHPYKEFGVWVFDDMDTGLVKEPLPGSVQVFSLGAEHHLCAD